jgi:dTDP-4-amino-4,6-dideoxygalactose transaminase
MPFRAHDGDSLSSHHLAVVVLPVDVARTTLRAELAAQGIQTSVHYPPIHSFSLYAPENERSLPVTDELAPRILTLPLYGHMRTEDVDLVTGALLSALEPARARVG